MPRLPLPPMASVSCSIRSRGKGGRERGLRAMDISFMGVVIPRHPEPAAPAAPVNHRPLLPHPHPWDGVHDAAAICGAVSRLLVHVEAAQAVGAVVVEVALVGWERPAGRRPGRIVAAMGFIVTLFKGFSFVFPILGRSSSILFIWGGLAMMVWHQPPGQATSTESHQFLKNIVLLSVLTPVPAFFIIPQSRPRRNPPGLSRPGCSHHRRKRSSLQIPVPAR